MWVWVPTHTTLVSHLFSDANIVGDRVRWNS
jgi:hypothetical protein